MNDEGSINHRAFLFEWIVATVIVWPLAVVAAGFLIGLTLDTLEPVRYQQVGLYTLGLVLLSAVLGILVGFSLGALQKLVVRRWLGHDLAHWRVLTVLGAVVGSLLVFMILEGIISEYITREIADPVAPTTLVVASIGVAQWFSLRRAVDRAWLWILMTVAATLFWTPLLENGFEFSAQLVVAVTVNGVVTGLTMLWLLGTLRRDRKRKADDIQDDPPEKRKLSVSEDIL